MTLVTLSGQPAPLLATLMLRLVDDDTAAADDDDDVCPNEVDAAEADTIDKKIYDKVRLQSR